MKNFSLSIILPTLNEEQNLKILIPELTKVLDKIDFEIIVVDDSSTDDTENYVNSLNNDLGNVYLLKRSEERSLPKSIFDGINVAKNKFIVWLDADGSMDSTSVKKLVDEIILKEDSVFIGSRFVLGGGFKGKQKDEIFKTNLFFRSIWKSEDSILSIFLSLIFNKLLTKLLPINVKDLTSGFLIGKRDYFEKQMFEGFNYGEYFIFVVTALYKKNIEIVEVPYFCKPRIFGVSKTSTNIFRLLSLTKPYLVTAMKCRKLLNESI